MRGQPATKREVVQEIRAAAKLSGAAGRFTGHSIRVTGSQRLAKAGVSEAKITAFGRWASNAFRLYVRDAVLKANGGELSKVVEAQLAGAKMREEIGAVVICKHGVPPVAVDDFRQSLDENPLIALTMVEVEGRWLAFAASLAKVSQEAANRPLPKVCLSEQGIGHRVVSCRYTACGWHWSRTLCTTSDEERVTCKKCLGTSIRWGAGLGAAFD